MEPSTTAPVDTSTDGIVTGDHHVADVRDHIGLIEEELLVEEISIDGMCGVY